MNFSFSKESKSNKVDADRTTLIECLRNFSPFDDFDDSDLILLSTRAQIERVSSGQKLFDFGDNDPWILCMLEGSLRLVAEDGRSHQLDAGTAQSKRPVAQLKPRKYTAISTTPGRYVRIDGTGFGDFCADLNVRGYFVNEIVDDPTLDMSSPHSHRLLQEDLELPSLPEVAMETCRLMNRADVDNAKLAKAINRDPAIAVKLVKAANSSIYYGKESIDTCERALLRLGMNATRQLVLAFSTRELFNAKSPALKKRMQVLWEHSTEVAAVCRVLAKKVGGFDPDQAQLAGLLHDIGAVAIVSYAQGEHDLVEDSQAIDALSQSLRGEIGGRMLTSWHFPESLIKTVVEAEKWWRDDEPPPELADLVIVGQLLSFIGKPTPPDVPNISRLPAFKKVSNGKLAPNSVLALIDEAQNEIAETRNLLQA